MSYYFHPAAETEHLETIGFYESRQAGLGLMYLNEFEQLLENVVHTPYRYRIERKPEIRCAFLSKFPFKIVFREVSGTVQVLAVAHKRRRPDYWINRL